MKQILFLIVLILLFFPSNSSAQTLTLNSDALLDGYVVDNGIVVDNLTGIAMGDEIGNEIARGFVSFDISTVPANATVIAATLRIYQDSITGTPYSDLGNVIADHIDYGPTLEFSDYNLAALQTNIGTLSDNANTEYKTLDVLTSVIDDISNSRQRSQYRLMFSPLETDSNNDQDFVIFMAAESLTDMPELVVTYSIPNLNVPTMTQWGMMIFVVSAGIGSVYYLRRRKMGN